MPNLFQPLPPPGPDEQFDPLASGRSFRLLRITSHGHATPSGEWYDQPEAEWVVLLSGAAQLTFADGATQSLLPGDHLLIPAHRRHRVESTSPDQPTVWLALHFTPD